MLNLVNISILKTWRMRSLLVIFYIIAIITLQSAVVCILFGAAHGASRTQ